MLVTAAHPNLSALPRYPTIVPDRYAKSKTFEYIINDYGSYATIFDYPTSDRQIGSITDVGGATGSLSSWEVVNRNLRAESRSRYQYSGTGDIVRDADAPCATCWLFRPRSQYRKARFRASR
jgi:hypothetical protein